LPARSEGALRAHLRLPRARGPVDSRSEGAHDAPRLRARHVCGPRSVEPTRVVSRNDSVRGIRAEAPLGRACAARAAGRGSHPAAIEAFPANAANPDVPG